MEDEFIPPQEPLPQPDYGIPKPLNLETVKYLTNLEGFTLEDKDNPESIVKGEMPSYIQAYFWVFLTKDMVLTFFQNGNDINRVMNMFEATVESFEMSLPPGKYDWSTLRDIDNLRAIVFFRVKRSWLGFERKQESTSIQEYRHDQNINSMVQERKPSFISRFFGGR